MASLNFEQEKNNFKEFYDDNFNVLNSASETFRNLIRNCLEEVLLETVTSRVKNREECISKFSRKYQAKLEQEKKEYEIKDYITDLIGVRVVCLYEVDIEQIRQILENNFEVINISDKISNSENSEDRFGYKSLHLDLKLNTQRNDLIEYKKINNFTFEVQIRTIIQDAWSVLDHKLKYKKSIPLSLKRRINRLAALFEIADAEFTGIKNETHKLETETKENNTTKEEIDNEILDVFQFLKIAQNKFPGYYFESYKIDGFVEQILSCDQQYTVKQFQEAIKQYFDRIDDYKNFQLEENSNNLNPYTMIRHILYLFNPDVFQSILFEGQQKNLQKWIEKSQNNE